MTALQVALEFAVIVFLGIFIVRIRLVGPEFRAALAKFVTNVALPCIIARSIYTQSERFTGAGKVMLLAVLSVLLLLAGGHVIYLLSGKGDLGKSARFSMAFGNFTFMGFPVVENLYGTDGLFVFTLFTLPVRLLFYPSPGFLLQPAGEKAKKPSLKEIVKLLFSPPVAAVYVGLVLYGFRLRPPLFLDKAVQAMGSTSSVLGMLLVGMGMAGMSPKTMWQRRKSLLIVLTKAIVCPLLLLGLFLLFPLESEIKRPLFLYGAVPVPSLLTAFSYNLGRSEEACQDASAAVLLSTLLSVATLPVWAMVGEKFL
jgi:predicted permease